MPTLKHRIKDERIRRLLWPLIALGVILLFNLVLTPGFFTLTIRDGRLFGTLVDILNRGAPVMILSVGMTLVYATKGIDISVGSVMAIAGALASIIIRPGYAEGILEYGEMVPLLQVVGIPLAVCLLLGMWNGVLVAYVNVQPMIATLILMVSGRGIAQLITKGYIIVFEHPPFQFIGSGFFLGLPFSFTIVGVLLLLTWTVTRKTSVGLFIEAVGDSTSASRYIGINARRVVLAVYMFCGFCAGLAGLIVTANIKAADANNCGLFLELDAIASVIIGGTMSGGRFTLTGSIIGTLIIQGLTTTVLTLGIPPEVNYIFKAVFILIVALIQSERFHGKVASFATLPRRTNT